MKNIKIMILMVVLVIIGSTYTVSSNDDGIDFCIWGFECGDEAGGLRSVGEFENYNFTSYGLSDTAYTNEDAIISISKALKDVINVSQNDYSEVIAVISTGDSFDEVYHLNLKIFYERYTTGIDEASPTGEYIQNIGELILNKYKGDCDDYAMALYLIAKEMKEEVRLVIGYGESGGHVWIQVKVDGAWKEYDSTSDRICDDCVSKDYSFIDYYMGEEE